MKKYFILLLTVAFLMLVGCVSRSEEINESTIFVNRDGTIKSVVVEDFQQDKYDEAELKEMIHETVSSYNGTHDMGDIKLISCVVNSNMANVEMIYKASNDYAEFNDRDFYFGTVSAALDAGYAKSAILKNAHGENTVSGSMINDLATYHMIVFDEAVNLSSYGSILYYSENLEIVDDHTVRKKADSTGLGYIIIK